MLQFSPRACARGCCHLCATHTRRQPPTPHTRFQQGPNVHQGTQRVHLRAFVSIEGICMCAARGVSIPLLLSLGVWGGRVQDKG